MTPSSRSDGRVTTEQRGQVLLIGIDRVSQQNRIDPTIYSALASAYYQLEHDENVRCGVLFGYGNDFSLGLDVAAFAPVLAQGTFQWQVDGQINPLGTTEPRLTKPFVAAVQGGVSFMANELLLAADIRIVASNAHFSQGEAQRSGLCVRRVGATLCATCSQGMSLMQQKCCVSAWCKKSLP